MNLVQFQKDSSMMAFMDSMAPERSATGRCTRRAGHKVSAVRLAGNVRVRDSAASGECTANVTPVGIRRHWPAAWCFQDSRLPLTMWFLAMYLLTGSKINDRGKSLIRFADDKETVIWVFMYTISVHPGARENIAHSGYHSL